MIPVHHPPLRPWWWFVCHVHIQQLVQRQLRHMQVSIRLSLHSTSTLSILLAREQTVILIWDYFHLQKWNLSHLNFRLSKFQTGGLWRPKVVGTEGTIAMALDLDLHPLLDQGLPHNQTPPSQTWSPPLRLSTALHLLHRELSTPADIVKVADDITVVDDQRQQLCYREEVLWIHLPGSKHHNDQEDWLRKPRADPPPLLQKGPDFHLPRSLLTYAGLQPQSVVKRHVLRVLKKNTVTEELLSLQQQNHPDVLHHSVHHGANEVLVVKFTPCPSWLQYLCWVVSFGCGEIPGENWLMSLFDLKGHLIVIETRCLLLNVSLLTFSYNYPLHLLSPALHIIPASLPTLWCTALH